MLREESGAQVELIVVSGEGDPEPRSPGPLEGNAIATAPPASDYYQKKNFGFTQSDGAIVVFADSDLAPEPGWLAALVAPFADPATLAVVGLTHLETRTHYERAMALFWIFDTRTAEDSLRPTRRLVSNNIAFRRGLFGALRFPDRPTYRGQCSELGATLERFGVPLWEATGARAAHPAPAGLAGFIRRALRAGRDAAWSDASRGVPAATLRIWRTDTAAVRDRVKRRAPTIGATMADRVLARCLAWAYYGVKALAYAGARARLERTQQAAPPSAEGSRAAVRSCR
jgi:hypothetical protein